MYKYIENNRLGFPVKNLGSQLIHWEITLTLAESSFWVQSVTSHWTHKMTHTVSLLWAFREFATHTVSLLWAICEMSSSCNGTSELTLWVASSQKAHSSSQCELILWVHCKLTKCPQNELSVSFNVIFQLVTFEPKLFTGIASHNSVPLPRFIE